MRNSSYTSTIWAVTLQAFLRIGSICRRCQASGPSSEPALASHYIAGQRPRSPRPRRSARRIHQKRSNATVSPRIASRGGGNSSDRRARVDATSAFGRTTARVPKVTLVRHGHGTYRRIHRLPCSRAYGEACRCRTVDSFTSYHQHLSSRRASECPTDRVTPTSREVCGEEIAIRARLLSDRLDRSVAVRPRTLDSMTEFPPLADSRSHSRHIVISELGVEGSITISLSTPGGLEPDSRSTATRPDQDPRGVNLGNTSSARKRTGRRQLSDRWVWDRKPTGSACKELAQSPLGTRTLSYGCGHDAWRYGRILRRAAKWTPVFPPGALPSLTSTAVSMGSVARCSETHRAYRIVRVDRRIPSTLAEWRADLRPTPRPFAAFEYNANATTSSCVSFRGVAWPEGISDCSRLVARR